MESNRQSSGVVESNRQSSVLRCDVHEGAPKQARPRKPNLCAVADPRKCDEFRDEIWTFQAPRDASIHEHVAALMGHVSAAALRVFGSAASRCLRWQIIYFQQRPHF